MLIYKDILTDDELLADSYDIEEIEDGFFLQAEGKWQVKGEVQIDTGANPSAEGGDEDGGGGESEQRVVDLIDAFRLNETSSYTKKDLTAYVKAWLGKVVGKLPESEAAELKAKAPSAIKFLLGKVKDLQFFLGESQDPEGTMIYAYYKEGASNPTFLYPKYALKEIKC